MQDEEEASHGHKQGPLNGAGHVVAVTPTTSFSLVVTPGGCPRLPSGFKRGNAINRTVKYVRTESPSAPAWCVWPPIKRTIILRLLFPYV